jgi:drug/metabolite transporter (DMT)-like permease
MTWLIAGLLAPLLWAATNLLDQIVIRKYYPNRPVFLMAINCLLQFIPFIVFALYKTEIFNVPFTIILILMATSVLNAGSFIAYYKAIEKDEASNAIPLFQLQPIIIFIGAYYLFGETITWLQGIGAMLIIFSSISILIDFKTKSINWSTPYLMGICALTLSLTTIIDRYLLKEYEWDIAFTWKCLGYFVFSILIFVSRPKLFSEALQHFKKPITHGLHYIFSVEIIATIANAFFLISLATTPSAGLTQTLTGFMPFFVLVMSYLAYKAHPEHFEKPKQGFHLGFHLICLLIMLIGLYLIY